jgi:hypothetical protein
MKGQHAYARAWKYAGVTMKTMNLNRPVTWTIGYDAPATVASMSLWMEKSS